MSPDILLNLTERMPMKQIDVLGKAYLQRYYAGTLDDSDIWVHRFLSCDGDRHLHNHPRQGLSLVLHGGYTEEYRSADDQPITLRSRRPTDMPLWMIKGMIRQDPQCIRKMRNLSTGNHSGGVHITPFTWHRISTVKPDTWTLMIVDKNRLPVWFFRDEAGELEVMTSSPRTWHRECKPRSATEGAVQ